MKNLKLAAPSEIARRACSGEVTVIFAAAIVRATVTNQMCLHLRPHERLPPEDRDRLFGKACGVVCASQYESSQFPIAVISILSFGQIGGP
jgi:hypothetical protein